MRPKSEWAIDSEAMIAISTNIDLSTIFQNFIRKPMQISEARRKISLRFGSNQLSKSWKKLTFFREGIFFNCFFFQILT